MDRLKLHATQASKPRGSRETAAKRIARLDKTAAKSAIDYGFLAGLAGFWIRRAQIRVFKSFAEHLREFDFRPVEVATLFILEKNGELTQIALADALGTDPSTVVGLLSRLEGRTLINRRRLASDRRFQLVQLSREGKDLLADIACQLTEHNSNVLKPLGEEERATLLDLLKRLATT